MDTLFWQSTDVVMRECKPKVMRVWLCTRQGKIHSNVVSDIACERIKVLGFQGALEASLGQGNGGTGYPLSQNSNPFSNSCSCSPHPSSHLLFLHLIYRNPQVWQLSQAWLSFCDPLAKLNWNAPSFEVWVGSVSALLCCICPVSKLLKEKESWLFGCR